LLGEPPDLRVEVVASIAGWHGQRLDQVGVTMA
jgi:hypothetical protein